MFIFRLKIAFLAPITILTTMKPILCAAFAAALVTAILANDDPPKAVPASDEKHSPNLTIPAPTAKEARGHGHEVHWTYSGSTGPEHWGELKKEFSVASHGTRQSPIDIVTKNTIETDLGAIQFHYNPHSEFEVRNNGHTLRVNVTTPEGKPNMMTIGKSQYKLLQFHFHAKSEHTINGRHSPMEMHLVHQLVEHHEDGHGKPAEQNLAVIGVMIEQLTDDIKAHAHSDFIQKVWQVLPKVIEETPETGKGLALHDMQPEGLLPSAGHRSYYRYSGSLTTPPCTESVKWTVLSEPVYYTKKQIEDFSALPFFRKIGGINNRPVQPLKARYVLRYKDHSPAGMVASGHSDAGHATKPPAPGHTDDGHATNPPVPGHTDDGHATKPPAPGHTDDGHAIKPPSAGLSEILHKGKLPVFASGKGPFSGKFTLVGDDGNRREETYEAGEIVARTEWHENAAVRVESEFSHGVEIKRTGWRGDKKWFEITFTVDGTPAGHGKPPVPAVPPLVPGNHGAIDEHGAPVKHGTTDGHGAPVKHGTTDRHGAPVKHGTTDGHGAPAKHGTTDGHGVPVKHGTTDGHGAPVKHGATDGHGVSAKHGVTDAHGATDAHGSTVNTATTKPVHKWPAFVPGNPDFPADKKPPSADHGSAKPHEAIHSGGHSTAPAARGAPVPDVSYEQLRKRLLADGQKLPIGTTEIIANIAKSNAASVPTPTIRPVPRSVGPAAELRADHLVYARDSALPYTGNTTLFDENGKKTYEGGFIRGRREGKGVEWHGTGQKYREGEFHNGSLHEGNFYWYFIGTTQKKIQVQYSAGKVVEARMWNRNGEQRW